MRSTLAIRSWLGTGGGERGATLRAAIVLSPLHALWLSLLFATVLLAITMCADALTGA